jgi:hypothetical protein
MTRYEQLCKAYSKNLSDFKTYKELCYRFAVNLMEQLKQEFYIPDDRLQLRSKDDSKEITTNMLEAMDMQKDTFWHIRFSITVCSEADEHLKESMSFEICIKKMPTHFLLSIPNEREFFIPEAEDNYNFTDFFNYLFTSLKDFYEQELDRFLSTAPGSGSTIKKEQSPIGFRFDVIDE